LAEIKGSEGRRGKDILRKERVSQQRRSDLRRRVGNQNKDCPSGGGDLDKYGGIIGIS